MAGSRVKILFYAINGTGLGHLSRLLAIARPMRDLLQALGHQPDLRFLTTSEGSAAAHDFPVYKLPSKTAAGHLPRAEIAASSKMLISQLVAQFSPHVLVTDTLAEGSYGELSFLLSYVGAAVLIDRHKDPSITASEVYRRHVVLYNKVLVPDHPGEAHRYPVPREARQQFVGPIHGFRTAGARSVEEVRATFGVEPGQRLIYLSGGGGSDSREGLEHLIAALAEDPRNFLLVGYGPLHRGRVTYRRNVIPLFHAEARELFPGLDAAVSAAGYNSYEELLAAGVPTLFYAQGKGMDRQDERIAHGLEQRWHAALDPDLCLLEPAYLRARLEEVLDSPIRTEILRALDQRAPSGGALNAAVEILGLAPRIARGRLYEAALHYKSHPDHGYVEAHQALLAWWEAIGSSEERSVLEEAAVVAWLRPSPGETGWAEAAAWGRHLAAIEPGLLRGLLRAWAAHRSSDEGQERQRLGDVLAALRAHGKLDVVSLFLERLKRPYQKGALLRFAALLESDEADRAERLLEALQGEPEISGARLEALLGEA